MTVKGILRAVCVEYGITVAQLIGPSRVLRMAHARGLAALLLRERMKMTFSEIGELLGHRDHTTILQACKVAKARRKHNDRLQRVEEYLAKEAVEVKVVTMEDAVQDAKTVLAALKKQIAALEKGAAR